MDPVSVALVVGAVGALIVLAVCVPPRLRARRLAAALHLPPQECTIVTGPQQRDIPEQYDKYLVQILRAQATAPTWPGVAPGLVMKCRRGTLGRLGSQFLRTGVWLRSLMPGRATPLRVHSVLLADSGNAEVSKSGEVSITASVAAHSAKFEVKSKHVQSLKYFGLRLHELDFSVLQNLQLTTDMSQCDSDKKPPFCIGIVARVWTVDRLIINETTEIGVEGGAEAHGFGLMADLTDTSKHGMVCNRPRALAVEIVRTRVAVDGKCSKPPLLGTNMGNESTERVTFPAAMLADDDDGDFEDDDGGRHFDAGLQPL